MAGSVESDVEAMADAIENVGPELLVRVGLKRSSVATQGPVPGLSAAQALSGPACMGRPLLLWGDNKTILGIPKPSRCSLHPPCPSPAPLGALPATPAELTGPAPLFPPMLHNCCYVNKAEHSRY